MVSPLASLTDSVHPRLTLAALGGKELDQPVSEEMKPPVEDLLLNLPVLSLPPHLVHQARSFVGLFPSQP